VAAVAVAFMALSQWVIPQEGTLGVTLRVALALAFPLALVPTGVLTGDEITRGRAMIAARLRRALGRGAPS
jgi:hypothetical protein